ncbi:hypothetical protein [Aminobacter aminovorans]|uniref:Uncharacterized protein n=1 Tax=Aminobacter aminovorans TaxID=83263 RepID=A0AAC8YL91_AMIAI|nr:hypothetical protein [Aminobacter aminovorans]AMS40495.1 hypothetical protein AA2016_1563 [Aminobacter aminovorans]MBB3706573.1 hypothetical protein [Aminobacter aminovorans]
MFLRKGRDILSNLDNGLVADVWYWRTMGTDDYAANWRGARRYQFDEEARRKRAELPMSTEQPPIDTWQKSMDYGWEYPVGDLNTTVPNEAPKVIKMPPFRWGLAVFLSFTAFSAAFYIF